MTQLLAVADDVATYVQDYGLPQDAVEQALGFATSLIQAATGQHLFYAEADTAIIPWHNTGWVELPERPAVSVTGVQFRGTYYGTEQTLTLQQWSLQAGGILKLWGMGGVGPDGGALLGTSVRGAALAVTYTHGFPIIPLDLQAVAVGVAIRMLHKPTEARNTSLDDYTMPSSTAGPATLTPSEVGICKRYRRKTFAPTGWGTP
jgi:hypothetical protein